MLLALLAGTAVAQEIRPTLDKIKETGAIQLGHRETSRPFSFLNTDGQPAGYSVDLCLQVAAAGVDRFAQLWQHVVGGGHAALS